MSFKRAFDKTNNCEFKTLVSGRTLSESQMKVVAAIIAHYDAKEDASSEDKERYGKRLYKRIEMFYANAAIFGKKAAPYFITKNVAVKTKDHLINLALFKQETVKTNATKADAGASEETTLDTATKKATAKSKSTKKEAKAKKESKAKKEAPAETVETKPVSEETQANVSEVL